VLRLGASIANGRLEQRYRLVCPLLDKQEPRIVGLDCSLARLQLQRDLEQFLGKSRILEASLRYGRETVIDLAASRLKQMGLIVAPGRLTEIADGKRLQTQIQQTLDCRGAPGAGIDSRHERSVRSALLGRLLPKAIERLLVDGGLERLPRNHDSWSGLDRFRVSGNLTTERDRENQRDCNKAGAPPHQPASAVSIAAVTESIGCMPSMSITCPRLA